MGHAGGDSHDASPAPSSHRRRLAASTLYGGVSKSGRQRRQVERYVAVPSTIDSQRLRELQRQQE
jgi:hypothetical protein